MELKEGTGEGEGEGEKEGDRAQLLNNNHKIKRNQVG